MFFRQLLKYLNLFDDRERICRVLFFGKIEEADAARAKKMRKNSVRVLTFFVFCVSLVAILTFCAGAKTVKSGDFTFDVNGNTATLVEYTGSASTVSVPSKINGASVTKIGDYAFWQNRKIVKVYLPSTATVIGEAVFNECTALVKVVLPEKLVTLQDSVFWFCTNLKYVVFGPNVKNFGQNVFTGCNKAITAYVVKGTPAEKYIGSLKTVRLGYRYITSLKAQSAVTLTPKATAKINVTVSPDIVYNRSLSFTSSDPKVATVSADGTVTALKCGKVTGTCVRQPITDFRCSCGHNTHLRGALRPLEYTCKCGARFRYRTNLEDEMVEIDCFKCGAPVTMILGSRGKYMQM